MKDQARFLVACDFLPDGVTLSSDSRVQRIKLVDLDKLREAQGFDGNDCLIIELKEETADRFTLIVSNYFGPLAGHGYEFIFRRSGEGLLVEGTRLWVS